MFSLANMLAYDSFYSLPSLLVRYLQGIICVLFRAFWDQIENQHLSHTTTSTALMRKTHLQGEATVNEDEEIQRYALQCSFKPTLDTHHHHCCGCTCTPPSHPTWDHCRLVRQWGSHNAIVNETDTELVLCSLVLLETTNWHPPHHSGAPPRPSPIIGRNTHVQLWTTIKKKVSPLKSHLWPSMLDKVWTVERVVVGILKVHSCTHVGVGPMSTFDASKSLMVHVEGLRWASQSNPSTLALLFIKYDRVDMLKVPNHKLENIFGNNTYACSGRSELQTAETRFGNSSKERGLGGSALAIPGILWPE